MADKSPVAVWEAFLTTPKIETLEEWKRIPWLTRLFIMTRVQVLHITTPTALLPIVIAHARGTLLPGTGALWFGAFEFLHMSHNMLNDATDHALGRDDKKSFRLSYGVHPLAQKLVSKTEFWTIFGAVTGAGVMCALALQKTWKSWLTFGVFGSTVFYTWPLKGYGIGELCVFATWGPLATVGGYEAVTGIYDTSLFDWSIPYGLAASAVLFGKHIDKIEESTDKGVYTLPVLLGDKPARYMAIGVALGMYASILRLVQVGKMKKETAFWACLPSFWTFPLFLKAFLNPRPDAKVVEETTVKVPLWFEYEAKMHWPIWYVGIAVFHVVSMTSFLTGNLIVREISKAWKQKLA